MVKVAVERNPYDGTWEVGWKHEDGMFASHYCGYRTKEEAEAEIPGFDERVARETQAIIEEGQRREREENARWPNIGYVRTRIKELHAGGKMEEAFDASDKLDVLLNLDLAEHISWPLPSWKAIKSGQVYGR